MAAGEDGRLLHAPTIVRAPGAQAARPGPGPRAAQPAFAGARAVSPSTRSAAVGQVGQLRLERRRGERTDERMRELRAVARDRDHVEALVGARR